MEDHLHKIVELLSEQYTSTEDEKDTFSVKPVTNPVIPEIKEIRITKKNKDRYSKILYIINKFKGFYISVPSEIAISTTGFLSDVMSQREVSRCISEMIRIGLISVSDDTFVFNNNSVVSHSKKYVWYPANADKIEEILKYCDVSAFSPDIKCKTFDIDPSKVVWTSKTMIKIPKDTTISTFKSFIVNTLKVNYPQLEHYINLVSDINRHYYEYKPERCLTYYPTISVSKASFVTRIGIRWFCDFCAYTKVKTEGKEFRNDYLFANGLNLRYDVKGSIPRVKVLSDTGKWPESVYDPYLELYKEYQKISDDYIPWSESKRNDVKNLFLRSFFEHSKESFIAHVERRLSFSKVKLDKEKANILNSFYSAIQKMYGKNRETSVFFTESNIYADVLHELLLNGYDVVTCYDAFYARKRGVNQNEFEMYMDHLVKLKAESYYSLWLSSNRSL